MFHYPGLTDAETFKMEAIVSSKTESVILHFHPYHDLGCSEGMKLRTDKYNGLPQHELYVDGRLNETS